MDIILTIKPAPGGKADGPSPGGPAGKPRGWSRSGDPFMMQYFDDFVIKVAEEIFAQALGRSVADVLVHNFLIREPSIGQQGESPTLQSKIEVLERLLAESFGDFHAKIMQIVVEEVYSLTGFEPRIESDSAMEALEKVRKVYPQMRAGGTAIS